MQVVASAGTDHHPFVRLVDWLVIAADRLDIDVLLQAGATPGADGIDVVDFLPADELGTRMRDADAVVCHGGPGTIALARSSGHVPIVIPRDPTFGEHVDDHQLRFAAKLASTGTIDVARSVDELVALLATPRARIDHTSSAADVGQAVDAFGSLIDDLMDGVLARRRWSDRILVRRTPRTR